MLLFCRKAQRIVHIPFFEPVTVEDEAKQIQIEDGYHACRKAASSSIGYIISLREHLFSTKNRSYLGELLLPFVSNHLPNVHHRAKKSYALVLLASKLVGKLLCVLLQFIIFLKLCKEVQDLITYEDVLEFFVQEWAPIVNSLHCAMTSAVEDFLWEVLAVVKELPTNEVRNLCEQTI